MMQDHIPAVPMILLLAVLLSGPGPVPAVAQALAAADTGELECTFFHDGDGDSWGDPLDPLYSCTSEPGYVENDEDCDDERADVHPGATERCDGVDHDCDGLANESDSADALAFYADADGDGFGLSTDRRVACSAPDGYAPLRGDCNDADAAIHPGAPETDCTDPIDRNCDGSVGLEDLDADGYSACEECNDADAATHPGAFETCDNEDDDCDGAIDENPTGAPTFEADSDGDAATDPARTVVACRPPDGYAIASELADCNDEDASVYPGAVEVCDGVDQDCDRLIDDDAADAPTWYADTDADGYGDALSSSVSCSVPKGSIGQAGDCNDADASVHPGTSDACGDGLDQDCNGTDPSCGDTASTDTAFADSLGSSPRPDVGCAGCSGLPGGLPLRFLPLLGLLCAVGRSRSSHAER
jgi:large repetitive protein